MFQAPSTSLEHTAEQNKMQTPDETYILVVTLCNKN